MIVHARLVLALIRAKLTGARARAVALATAVRRALSDGIVRSVGISIAMLAALSALVCATGCPAPTPANGAVSVAWAVRLPNGLAVSCASVGGRFVALRIRNRGSGAITATAFPCADARGTAQLAPGLYDVSFQLDDADGGRLAIAPDQTGVSVVSGQVKPLAPAVLVLGGKLVLSFATSATTNCKPPTAGGAGVTGTSVALEDGGGSCVAVTFTRQRGAEQRGTYAIDCNSMQIAPCIEKDETLTAIVSPGSYHVHARGKIGPIDCWQRDDLFDVLSTGTVSRTLGLLHINGPGC